MANGFNDISRLCGLYTVQRLGSRSILVACILAVAGCAQTPDTKHTKHSKVDPVWGVEAPKKIVADGDPVPPGGGRYQVGKPYMVAGQMYFPHEDESYDKTGLASWYGIDFHGRETANGEVYDKDSISAAHKTMPIPSYARVTNLENGKSILVRVNDRGPYVGERMIDVSERTAELLGFKSRGLTHVRVQYVARAPVEGSDQRMLVASLRNSTSVPNRTQDKVLIAQADRTPSDGRMAELAAKNVLPPLAAPAKSVPSQPKPIVLAAATTAPVLPAGYLPQPKPGTANRAPDRAIVAALPPETRPPQSRLKPTTSAPAALGWQVGPGGISSTAQNAPVRKPTSNSVEGIIEALPDQPGGPMDLGPAPAMRQTTTPPVVPSRYGPNGNVYRPKLDPPAFAETVSTPGGDAIERLIVASTLRTAHVDLGAYAEPDNAARVADLMRPYGPVEISEIHGGLGERLVLVRLAVPAGMLPGEVVNAANRMGIRDAAVID